MKTTRISISNNMIEIAEIKLQPSPTFKMLNKIESRKKINNKITVQRIMTKSCMKQI
jgi:hypothetical protein